MPPPVSNSVAPHVPVSPTTPDISLEEAVAQKVIAKTVSKNIFWKEFSGLKGRLDKQEGQSFQVIITVLVAAFFIYIATAVQIAMYFAGASLTMQSAETRMTDAVLEMKKENMENQLKFEREMDALKLQALKQQPTTEGTEK